MRLYTDIFNDSQMTDTNSLSKALMLKPDKLSSVITYLAGRYDERFPLSMLSEGVGNMKTIESFEYEYDVVNKLNQARPVVSGPTSGTPGLAGALITVTFPDAWFIKQYNIVGKSGIQARIMDNPKPVSNGFEYVLQISSPDPSMFIPVEDFEAGALWASLYPTVGIDFSRGNASNWVAPSKIRHKLATMRKSYSFSGNVAEQKVMTIDLSSMAGKPITYWTDFEEWQYMLQWKEECENYYWYGVQTYDEKGIVQLKDDNGSPIIVGPGLLEQIINKDTYSKMTTAKLKQVVRDLFYGMTDGTNKSVTLFTGIGGADEFDQAMKTELASKSYIKLSDNKFVNGSGRKLELGGFFTSYQHVDGHVVNVVKVPLFDHGAYALSAGRHPETGLSLESYRMVFVDMSSYDGEPNLQMITKAGRSMLRWAVGGSVIPKGYTGNDMRASDIDGASVHFLKVGGICLRRFNTSIDLQCVA